MESQIKKEVLSLVQEIDDEILLQLSKADIDFFKEGGPDITDGLTPEELEELRALASEDPFKDTVGQEEYDEFLNKWRKK